MPENAPIILSMSSLPVGYCITDAQTFANDMVARMSGTLPGTYSTFVIGSSTPDTGDRDKLWIKTDPTTGLLVTPWALFRFFNGQWLARHPVTASSDGESRIWKGTLAAIDTYDGGEVGAVGDWTGPMWERDTDFDAKFLVGVGAFATEPAVAEGGTGGADQVTLTNANTGTHYHGVGNFAANNDDLSNIKRTWTKQATDPTLAEYWTVGSFSTGGGELPGNADLAAGSLASTNNIDDGTNAATAHSNIPPYRGIYVLKRTARVYYKG